MFRFLLSVWITHVRYDYFSVTSFSVCEAHIMYVSYLQSISDADMSDWMQSRSKFGQFNWSSDKKPFLSSFCLSVFQTFSLFSPFFSSCSTLRFKMNAFTHLQAVHLFWWYPVKLKTTPHIMICSKSVRKLILNSLIQHSEISIWFQNLVLQKKSVCDVKIAWLKLLSKCFE